MAIITLTTDFGLQDGFVGMMKGVIFSICPQAQIVDISHQIPPQQIRAGAFVLARAVRYFPAGSVHVAVVDPGVGSDRESIAALVDGQYFIAPDNGLLWPLFAESLSRGDRPRVVRLQNPAWWREEVSRTFHGRDVFAPVGAHLACGLSLDELGVPVRAEDLVPLPRLRPQRLASGLLAHVQYVDHFGNLFTDVSADLLPAERQRVRIEAGAATINGLASSYAARSEGSLVALINSENWLEIAVVNGSAADMTGLQPGDTVKISFL